MLRQVHPDDIEVFFHQQRDPEANEMAAFPARDHAAHLAHWARILRDDGLVARTIVVGDRVVGNIGSFMGDGQRQIGYWIGREYWGRGYATAALGEFLVEVRDRPLFAHVAEHNHASLRVLEKCGFIIVGEAQHEGDPIRELVLQLPS
ncbi:MAG TPA: GNAT family N-acetyltransferase [Thermomicrobiales bacterium]|nr:GNAT family N-acetyltransferase [Thermomicrobiales bacterium]